jgi:hypothetical protein
MWNSYERTLTDWTSTVSTMYVGSLEYNKLLNQIFLI